MKNFSFKIDSDVLWIITARKKMRMSGIFIFSKLIAL